MNEASHFFFQCYTRNLLKWKYVFCCLYLNVDLCLQNPKIHIRVNPAKPFLTQILKLRFYLNLEHLFCLLNVLYIIQVNAFLYNDALCCLCLKYKNYNLLTFQILKRTESYFQIQLWFLFALNVQTVNHFSSLWFSYFIASCQALCLEDCYDNYMYWNCIENYALIPWYPNENDIYLRKKSKGLILHIIVSIHFYLYRPC